MDNETTVSDENQETSAEQTATPSESEEQTTPNVEEAPAGVSDQPTDEVKEEKKPPRSEQRIHELSKRLKEAEQRANYWEKLNAPPVAPLPAETAEGEFLTADQIADSVVKKQQTQEWERQNKEANKEMERDILDTLKKYPDLETNDKLGSAIFAYAQANKMRILDAADEVKTQIKADEERVKKELLASRSGRVGVTTPQSGKVSTGEEKININSLSDEEKAANWSKILESYQK